MMGYQKGCVVMGCLCLGRRRGGGRGGDRTGVESEGVIGRDGKKEEVFLSVSYICGNFRLAAN